MFLLRLCFLFAVFVTGHCHSSSKELNNVPTGEGIEHEKKNVDAAEIPSEVSTEILEDVDHILKRDYAGDSENFSSTDKHESRKKGEPMPTDDTAETDTDKNGDKTEERSEQEVMGEEGDKDDFQRDDNSEGK